MDFFVIGQQIGLFQLHSPATSLQNVQNRRQAAFLIRLAKVKIFDRPAVVAHLKTPSQYFASKF